MSKRTKVEVSTRQFLRSHGRPPRGFGQWVFEIVDASNDTVVATLNIMDKYGEAKKTAVANVREYFSDELATGYLFVSVAP